MTEALPAAPNPTPEYSIDHPVNDVAAGHGVGLRIETIHQFDKAIWRRYDFPDGTFLLTAEGREIVRNAGMGNIIRAYAKAAASGEADDPNRQYLAHGGNAQVFSVGDKGLVIKERRVGGKYPGEEIEPALQRMDELLHVIQSECPHWIGMPKHYGIYKDKATEKEFLLMEKIDSGVTVGDILDYGSNPREAHLEEAVAKMFGPVTPELKQEIREQFDKMIEELNNALMARSLDPDDYLPDLEEKRNGKFENRENVLVTPVNPPIAGKRFKFWLIDQ
jgi:hypothetical protein